ncbi:MAG: heme-copper oxidase subunit III [Candidatus Omnitrophica bacterium]|nr:heme-copper oxidase subunit III [Candidatus Omnitrophota bacterium]
MNQALTAGRDVFGNASTGKLAMWLLIAIDGLSFGGLLIGSVALRMGAPEVWPQPGAVLNIPLTAFNTFLLICTSFTMVMALNAVQKNDQNGLVKNLIWTMLGGIVFLTIQVYEYSHFIRGGEHLAEQLAAAGMSGHSFIPSTSVYAAAFYVVTGFHGVHVLSGVIYIACILIAALKGRYTSSNYNNVEILGLFWHFVDLVWILVFTVVYLI